jgi:hypothetical protein
MSHGGLWHRFCGARDRESGLQVELQIGCAFDGIEAVGFRRGEAERLVEGVGGLHGGESVEEDAVVAEGFCFGDQGEGELTADAEIAPGGADVEPLHFAVRRGKAAESAAAQEPAFVARQQKGPTRRSVLPLEMEEFLVEILEIQTNVERRGVFADQFAGRLPERG